MHMLCVWLSAGVFRGQGVCFGTSSETVAVLVVGMSAQMFMFLWVSDDGDLQYSDPRFSVSSLR